MLKSFHNHISTNSTNDSPHKSLNNLDDHDDEVDCQIKVDPLGYLSYNDFDTLLPLTINGMRIQKVSWDYFCAKPNLNSGWKAHCYWTVGYNYEINMKKMKKSNNIRYRLSLNVWCILSNRSWVKVQWDRLLEHETGHYLLGCLCALEFKKKADKFKYTKNYRMECTKIFQETFQQFLQLEREYDEETCHSQNVVQQKKWNTFIKSNLLQF